MRSCYTLAGSSIAGALLTRTELREESDRFRDEMFRCRATKADVANLEAWLVGVSLVVVLNVLGTAGVILATVLAG